MFQTCSITLKSKASGNVYVFSRLSTANLRRESKRRQEATARKNVYIPVKSDESSDGSSMGSDMFVIRSTLRVCNAARAVAVQGCREML